jgi:hypothetical protein
MSVCESPAPHLFRGGIDLPVSQPQNRFAVKSFLIARNPVVRQKSSDRPLLTYFLTFLRL